MKFYVSSGDVKEIVNASDFTEGAKKAVIKSIERNKSIALGSLMAASQTGFFDDEGHNDDNDMIILTEKIIDELTNDGILGS